MPYASIQYSSNLPITLLHRYEEIWRHLHRWFPEGSLTVGDTENGYTPKGVVETSMHHSATMIGNSTHTTTNEVIEDETLGAVTDLVRAQVITMSRVMEKQWIKLTGTSTHT